MQANNCFTQNQANQKRKTFKPWFKLINQVKTHVNELGYRFGGLGVYGCGGSHGQDSGWDGGVLAVIGSVIGITYCNL